MLDRLVKGHRHADTIAVAAHCRAIGLPLSPTFVAFTPWTTVDSYCAWLEELARLDLVHAVAPIQYAIRLLVPEGSLMLELEDMRACMRRFDPSSLTHIWTHPDPRVDALQQDVQKLLEGTTAPGDQPRATLFAAVRARAYAAAGRLPPEIPLIARAIPYWTSLGTVEQSPRQSRWL